MKQALIDLEQAQQNAVVLFAEAVRRKIYRDLGYSSIYQYAELELGFKKSKTAQFLRLAESFEKLPGLRESVASGELSWTKAREVAKVATPETEGSWIQEAKEVPSRELERRVSEKRRQARAGFSGHAQATLEIEDGGAVASAPEEKEQKEVKAESDRAEIHPPVPMDLHVRMPAEQHARYQALVEVLRKGRVKEDKTELLLAGLEQLVLGATGDVSGERDVEERSGIQSKKFPRVNSRSPYQVVVQKCPDCNRGSTPTSRGEKTLAPGSSEPSSATRTSDGPGNETRPRYPKRYAGRCWSGTVFDVGRRAAVGQAF